MTSVFSWQNSIGLCPASFCTPRPNTPGISSVPTFAFQSPIMKRTYFLSVCCRRPTRPFRTNTPQKMSFSLQETGMQKQEVKKHLEEQANLALAYRMKQDIGQQSFVKRTHWSQQTPSSSNTREDSAHGHHQMVNTKIRLMISLQLKKEKLYTVNKNKTRRS